VNGFRTARREPILRSIGFAAGGARLLQTAVSQNGVSSSEHRQRDFLFTITQEQHHADLEGTDHRQA
jgi:hypothetical protein